MKWEIAEGELPMWVGDMDFVTPPEIVGEIVSRARLGAYGYTLVPEEWYASIGAWWRNRYAFELKEEWLVFTTGVVPAISCLIKRLTNVGDNVVVITPVYGIFFNSILNGGRHALECPLSYRDGEYRLDEALLEQVLAQANTTLLLFCNPHNPVGKVWSKEELAKIGALCKKHGVTVLSDEIHCDLVEEGVRYTPFAAASDLCAEISVTCIAPNKTFNLAGLQGAAVFVPDDRLRRIVVRGLNSDEVAEPNCFACVGAVAAYTKGGAWCDEVRRVIAGNKRFAERYLRDHLPAVGVCKGQATYFLWLDCSSLCDDTAPLRDFIRSHSGLVLSAGGEFRGNGRLFLRMNVACPRRVVEDGLDRFKRSVGAWIAQKGSAGKKS